MAFGSDMNAQRNKPTKFGGNILMVALLVVSVAFLVLYTKEGQGGIFHGIQGMSSAVVSPFAYAGSGIGAAADAAAGAVEEATASDSSVQALKDENAKLKQQVAQLEEHRAESERLQGLLGIQSQYALDMVTGRVIGRSTDAWNQVITVDIGSADGVEPGLAVVGSSGLVGHVVSVTPRTCDVRLITDQQSGIAVMIQSNREQGILNGSLEGLLYLDNIDPSVAVSQGDVIITSGMGGSYPKGIVVGTVANVESAAGTTDRSIIVSPLSSADPLEEVAVVKNVGKPASDDGSASAASGEDTSKEGE